MEIKEIYEKLRIKELTICETCDDIFPYIPQKRFCDECKRKKMIAYQRAYRKTNREKELAYRRAYREANREKLNAKERARYHAKKTSK